MSNPLPPRWLGAAVVLGAFATLTILERRRPLRAATESPARRDLRNFAVAAVSAVALRVTEKPAVERATRLVQHHRWGLARQVPVPAFLQGTLAIVLMDYTLYLWHVLTHRVPFLWRFHLVHHIDRDLSASTALRFHFGELMLSVPWRVAQVLLLGVGPRALAIWQATTLIGILFHHSNLRLPPAVERPLSWLVVTPRMHGIHHSIRRTETNSNWSSGLTLWDRLHGTLRLDVPQQAITIGVPAYRTPAEMALPSILAMPFESQRPSWLAPGTGAETSSGVARFSQGLPASGGGTR
jgi:sterol desaturase/sphingolipid hydroxylase (fatty acid hydroxylase superfamily)